jgi:hypothetical protein
MHTTEFLGCQQISISVSPCTSSAFSFYYCNYISSLSFIPSNFTTIVIDNSEDWTIGMEVWGRAVRKQKGSESQYG